MNRVPHPRDAFVFVARVGKHEPLETETTVRHADRNTP